MKRRTPEQIAALKASVGRWCAEHADDEKVRLARHIAALECRAERYEPAEWSRLDDADRDGVHDLIQKFSEERSVRVAEQRQKIVSSARRLGREVRAHRVTLDNAEAQLDRYALTLDQESPPIPLIPYREAAAIAREAFAEGFGGSPCQR
jgi:hypothetical protein